MPSADAQSFLPSWLADNGNDPAGIDPAGFATSGSIPPWPPELPPTPTAKKNEGEVETNATAPSDPLIQTPPPLTQTPPPQPQAVLRSRVAESEPRVDSGGWVRTTIEVPFEQPTVGGPIRLQFTIPSEHPRGYRDVCVRTERFRGVRSIRTNGTPRVEGNQLIWNIGELRTDQKLPLVVVLPPDPQTAAWVGTTWMFEVSYLPVPLPILDVACDPVDDVAVGESTVIRTTVTNPSEVPADRVVVRAESRGGASESVEVRIGEVPAKHTVEVAVGLPPVPSGHHEWMVWAETEATPGLSQRVIVRGIELMVEATVNVSEICLLDETVEARIVVKNIGPIPARSLRIEWETTDEFVRETANASGTEGSVAELSSGEEWTVLGTLRGVAPGSGNIRARVVGPRGVVATAEAPVACRISTGSLGLLDELLSTFRTVETFGPSGSDTPEKQSLSQTGERHIVFHLGGVGHAVPIGAVREVVRPPAITPAPGSPAWLVGVANVRGDVATVIDLPRFLDLDTDANERHATLIVQTGDDLVGLLVDDVAGIRQFPTGPIDATVRDREHRVTAFLSGVAELDGRLLQILDLPLIVAATETEGA